MNEMSELQLRELDAWICENVFLWELKQHSWPTNPECNGLYWTCKDQTTSGRPEADASFSPTTDPAANRELEKRILEHVMEHRLDTLKIWMTSSFEYCATIGSHYVCAPSLELALCLLAKKVWGGEV